jgi:hypothetical protein
MGIVQPGVARNELPRERAPEKHPSTAQGVASGAPHPGAGDMRSTHRRTGIGEVVGLSNRVPKSQPVGKTTSGFDPGREPDAGRVHPPHHPCHVRGARCPFPARNELWSNRFPAGGPGSHTPFSGVCGSPDMRFHALAASLGAISHENLKKRMEIQTFDCCAPLQDWRK